MTLVLEDRWLEVGGDEVGVGIRDFLLLLLPSEDFPRSCSSESDVMISRRELWERDLRRLLLPPSELGSLRASRYELPSSDGLDLDLWDVSRERSLLLRLDDDDD